MTKYVLKRLVMCILVIIIAAIIIFSIMYLVPGDPVEIMLGNNATVAQKDELRERWGLNDPYFVRLGNFLYNAFLRFNLGESYTYQRPVMAELLERFPITLTIGLASILVDVLISIPLGIFAALKNGKWQDRSLTVFAMLCVSVPEFWFALLMVILFSVRLGWLPPFGVDTWKGYILPIVACSLAGIGGMLRQTRSGMLDVMKSDFVVTARSKGVSKRKVITRHMLPNSLIPVITVVGAHFGRCVAGTVIVEQIFSIPGVGRYMLQCVNNRDYPVIQGSVIFLALTTSVIMLVVDLVYAFVDPRIKAQYSGK